MNAKLFKVDPYLAATVLSPLFIDIWESEVIPDDWSKGVIIS